MTLTPEILADLKRLEAEAQATTLRARKPEWENNVSAGNWRMARDAQDAYTQALRNHAPALIEAAEALRNENLRLTNELGRHNMCLDPDETDKLVTENKKLRAALNQAALAGANAAWDLERPSGQSRIGNAVQDAILVALK